MKRKVKRPFDNEQFRKGYVAGIFAAEKELNTELLHFAEKAHKIMSEGTFPDYGVKINFKDSNNTITTNLDMKTEEKAKKYDEALERMRKLYPGLHGATKEDAEHYFPELKESEDERTRKELIELISCMHDADPRKKRWIAYLEKQKEQKPLEFLSKEKVFAIMNKLTSLSFCVPLGNDEEKKIHEITCDVRSLLDYPIEQKPTVSRKETLYQLFQNGLITLSDYLYLTEEQKPAEIAPNQFDGITYGMRGYSTEKPAEWSDKDKEMLGKVLECIRFAEDRYQLEEEETNGVAVRSWLLEHIIPQPKQEQKPLEWSEEDENALEYLHELIDFGTTEKFFDAQTASDMRKWLNTQLKSLSDRFNLQPQVKEEQKEQKPEVKLKGWIARDKEYNSDSGLGLVLFKEKPRRSCDSWSGAIASLQLAWEAFPDLKWEDEPMEVEVTITKK